MKFAHSDISEVFQWNQPFIPVLVIENQSLFRKFVKDIFFSLDGATTSVVLSIDDKIIDFSKYAEVITDFVNFDLNQRMLLNKICAALERNALSAENYLATQQLLMNIENKVGEWAFEFPCNIIATKITVTALLKGIGVELRDDYQGESGDAERILDYIELVREFDRDKLFITINMRSWFSDSVINCFMETAVSHEYKVLMLESKAHPLLKTEKRLTVDEDLCEF